MKWQEKPTKIIRVIKFPFFGHNIGTCGFHYRTFDNSNNVHSVLEHCGLSDINNVHSVLEHCGLSDTAELRPKKTILAFSCS